MREDFNLNTIIPKREKDGNDFFYDVFNIGKQIDERHFELEGFDDSGVEYLAGDIGRIWSIGLRLSDQKIIASLDSDLYQNREYVCLWLR